MMLLTLLLSCAQAAPDARFTEHLIAKIPEQSAVYDVTGNNGETREHHCAWSPDGTSVAWIATVEGVPHTAWNAEIGAAFAELQPPLFAANGSHFAFRGELAEAGSSWAVELDGERVASAPFIGPLAFAPDGAGLGFWEVSGDEGVLVRLDTIKHSRWKQGRAVSLVDQNAGTPHFSRDGKRMIATAGGAEEHVLMLATRGKTKPVADAKHWITAARISPDGREYGYVLYDSGSGTQRSYAVRGKKRLGASMDTAGFGRFSPDGKHYAYTVRQNGMAGLAIDKDSTAKCEYYAVIDIAWDSAGERVAYVANYDGPSMVAANGAQFEESGGMWFVVNRAVGSKAGEDGPGFVEVADPVFSPASDHLTYRARRGLRWLIVVDGQQSEVYDEVGPPIFSSDGTRVAFGARKGRELLWKVLEVESAIR
jgi:WD40 repeat protein